LKFILIRLLLFLYLTSSYLSTTHIHHDKLESIDCKIHNLVKNLNSSDTPNEPFKLFECNIYFKTITFYANFFIQPIIKGFDAHAPPFFPIT